MIDFQNQNLMKVKRQSALQEDRWNPQQHSRSKQKKYDPKRQ
jgi:hypothetical protein